MSEQPPAALPELRILTEGLDEEEIAAVTSVVTAAIEAQRAGDDDGREAVATANARRWRHSVGPLAVLAAPRASH